MAAAALVLMLAMSGCSTAPVQAMSDARQAVQAAARAGAPRYAPADYAAARRWLDDAQFALQGGDYERARSSAAKAAMAARAGAAHARAARRAASPDAATKGGGAGLALRVE